MIRVSPLWTVGKFAVRAVLKISAAPMAATILVAALSAAAPVHAAALAGSHPVLDVPDGGVLLVNFNGLPVQVRLAHVRPADDSRARVAGMVRGQSVRLEYAEELRCDDAGRPTVYVFLSNGTLLNVELVRKGLAAYDYSKARSQRYHAHMDAAEAAAKKEKAGMWGGGASSGGGAASGAGGPGPAGAGSGAGISAQAAPGIAAPKAAGQAIPAGGVCAELRSSQYHAPGCRYAKLIPPGNLIVYASPEKAEQAGKHPCWICFSERAEKSAFGSKDANQNAIAAGKLVGLKGDNLFHSPCCPRIKNARREDLAGFQAPGEAQAAGRLACFECLRLRTPPGAPPCPPQEGECIGRCPPYFRPCMRAPADASGLCSECQGR
ncbi:MAG: thermonuclease family protein [Planctomycetota bacterium]|nr:thermonuclease family protein [Planctomycetota bacterium]